MRLLSLPSLRQLVRGGLVRGRLERRMVSKALDEVECGKTRSLEPGAKFLSGNQQKIAVAKWLLTECPNPVAVRSDTRN